MRYSIRIISVLLCSVFFYTLPTMAQAEQVTNFHSNIYLSTDNEAYIDEEITYDFGHSTERHGIYRDIPQTYAHPTVCIKNETKEIDDCLTEAIHPIIIQEVTDQYGIKQPFTLDESSRETVRVKIGDSKKTVSGTKIYRIKYYFPAPVTIDPITKKTLFAWNVTGNGWPVPIKDASVNMVFSGIEANQLQDSACYTGTTGSTIADCVVQQDKTTITVKSTKTINPYNGMTVQVSFQEGVVNPAGLVYVQAKQQDCFIINCLLYPNIQIDPTAALTSDNKNLMQIQISEQALFVLPSRPYLFKATQYPYKNITEMITVRSNETSELKLHFVKSPVWKFIEVHLPWISAALYLAFAVLMWVRYGRDPKISKVIVTEFDPPKDLSPIEAGFVIKSQTSGAHLTAQVIDLAIRGYLVIEQTEQMGVSKYFKKGEYQYSYKAQTARITEDWNSEKLSSIDRLLLVAFFGENGIAQSTVAMDTLKKTFHKDVTKIKEDVTAQVVAKKLITGSSKRFISIGITIAILWIIASVAAVFFLDSVLFVITGIPAGIIGITFAVLMGKRTVKGTKLFRYLQGYEKYLRVAEKDRIAFFNDPKKYQALFEQVLPYAIVLGVEKEWCKQFDGLITQPPDWYQGNMTNGFVIASLASNLTDFSSVLQSASSAPASSGGVGGAVGGGFGGGGGGSW